MVAQPQQPIYPDQLRFELDRQYGRLTDYVDARYEKVVAQMRVDRQESLARDTELRNGLNELRNGMKDLVDLVLTLTQKVSDVEAVQRETIETLAAIRQEMREGFAAQAERHNELMVRVERLERGNNQPPAET